MGENLKFDLVSPEALIISKNVDVVMAPGLMGDFSVMPNHAPLMALLRTGVVRLYNNDQELSYFIRDGFADITSEGLTILAGYIVSLDGGDQSLLNKEIENLQEQCKLLDNETERSLLNSTILSLQAI